MTVIVYPRHEVLAAFLEFRRRGAVQRDWPAWASLFTEDATYIEHCLGRFHGRQAILEWIVPTMADFPSMSLWIDWWIVDGNRVYFYIWNHLPDPARAGTWYSFPNASVIEYAGGGKWCYEEDFYNPADSERVVREWVHAGGRRDLPPDDALRAIPDWAPQPKSPPFSRHEVEAQFWAWVQRGERAAGRGAWSSWANQFAADARYFDHHYGRFQGPFEIRTWARETLTPFPGVEFPVDAVAIEGNRVVAILKNRLPHPSGGAPFEVRTLVVLHYAGDGLWSYEEDVYNPREAGAMLTGWLDAGGVLPEGASLRE